MKIISMIAIFIYTLLFSMIGAVLIALSLRSSSLDSMIALLNYAAHAENIRTGLAVTGLALIMINISIAHLSLGRLRKYKSIAFENPDGPVTLSLSTIEDYIRKVTARMPEIKSIRPIINAGKNGIEINAKVVLYTGVNIPEISEKIQNAVRQRLQEIVGIEEKVLIKVHVSKIVERENKKPEPKGPAANTQEAGFKGEIEYGYKE